MMQDDGILTPPDPHAKSRANIKTFGKLAARSIAGFRWPPYWADVSYVSNSSAARAVILIPLVGYWIILNDQLFELSALSRKLFAHTNDPPQPVAWRLFAAYFGLCFVALASFVYQWKCPREVKTYETPVNYIAGVLPHISDIEAARIENDLRERDPAAFKAIRERHAYERPDIRNDADFRAHWKDYQRNVLQAHYDICNREPLWARWLVGTCYILGGIILLVPAANVFVAVLCALSRAIHLGDGTLCRWWTGCC
jgi:hypothetical protein